MDHNVVTGLAALSLAYEVLTICIQRLRQFRVNNRNSSGECTSLQDLANAAQID